MTKLFTPKFRIKDEHRDIYGTEQIRHRVIKARTMSKVLDQVNRLTRWGWTVTHFGGVTPQVTITKKELVCLDVAETQFPRRYDDETKTVIDVYYKYATTWALTWKKRVRNVNSMLARGYEVTLDLNTGFGYRTVFHKTYVKDMAEERA